MDDEELPNDAASEADEHVPGSDLENPTMVLQICVT